MIKLGIEEAVIRAKMGEEPNSAKIVEKRMDFYGSYAQAMMNLATSVGGGIGLKVLIGKVGKSGRRAYLIGFEKDVDRAITLIESLQLQCAAAQSTWWKTDMASDAAWLSGMEKFKARRQFTISFGHVVGVRLKEQRQETVVESTGTDLVLVNQSKKIDSWVADKYGALKSTRSSMHGSAAGRMGGQTAGHKASLNGTQVGGGRTAIR